jgi:hypothetical protein
MGLIVLIILVAPVVAGPIAFAACQSACNYGAVCCYAKVGIVFGTVTLAGAATGPVGWFAWLTTNPIPLALLRKALA